MKSKLEQLEEDLSIDEDSFDVRLVWKKEACPEHCSALMVRDLLRPSFKA